MSKKLRTLYDLPEAEQAKHLLHTAKAIRLPAVDALQPLFE